jgi:transposase
MASGQLAIISQKTKLAEAIRYALSLWDGLRRFTTTAASR